MLCWECRLEFDEMNESQPVCPGCGELPRCRGDSLEFSAIFDGLPEAAIPHETELPENDSFSADQTQDRTGLPRDLREAADEAEGLLEAIGFATFHLPQGLRLFRLPTERVM